MSAATCKKQEESEAWPDGNTTRGGLLDGRQGLRSTGQTLSPLVLGTEWIVDAHGCDPSRLRSGPALARLFDRIVEELGLHPIEKPLWHLFPGKGGITGVLLLSE